VALGAPRSSTLALGIRMRHAFLLVLTVLGCSCAVSPHSVSVANQDEHQIYSIWLTLVLEKEPQAIVIIREHTAKPKDFDYPSQDIFKGWSINGKEVTVDQTTLADFKRANRTSVVIRVELPVPHEYLSTEELNKVFGERHGWKGFRERHPHSHGFYSFARVGFSRDGTEALMYVEEYAGSLEAGGRYVLFRKFNGHWGYVAEKNAWIS